MLNTEWAQVEVIDLINDGSGLGFGIIGGRSTGVVVKTILPGGVADRDARLQSGDHILQIGEVNLRGMGSDQVAVVLRQSGSHVRLVVARPIEPTSPDFQVRQVGRSAPIVETRVLNDPEELDRRLSLLQNGYTPASSAIPTLAINAPAATTNGQPAPPYTNGEQPDLLNREKLAGEVTTVTTEAHLHYQHPQVEGEGGSSASSLSPPVGAGGPLTDAHQEPCGGALEEEAPTRTYTEEELSLLAEEGLPEMETIELEVTKDHQGLGITIAGYVCEKEELSGIFVKSINAGSAADRNGQIQVNDQIVEVDGRSLAGLSNHAAVDVLRATGQIVHLRLARYLRGPKYEQLQQAIANSELKTTPTTPNPPRAPVGRGSLKHRSRGSLRTAVTRQANIGGAQRPTSLVPVLVAPPPGGGGGGGGVAQHSVNQVSRSDSCTPPQPEPRRPRPQRPSRLGDLPSSEAICSALGELERGEEESVLEAINPALSPPTSSSTIIADVPTFPSISSQPLQSAGLPAGIASSYATTTNVPQLSSAIPQLSSDVPPLSSGISSDVRLEDIELMIDTNYSGDLRPSVESAIQRKWSRIVGPEFDIVVAQLSKFEEGGGLGISLEGTVDVEGGREVRPHHYIRSILPDGPVGKNNRLCSGDELLEVNGQKLLGLNHVEVVGILKELPRYVRLVCGRRAPGAPPPLHPIDAPTADRDTFAARNILGGSLQNLIPGSERLVKAKSDGSLASSATAATNDNSFNRMKSRSLEPLTGLAMWSSECQVIELTKGDRGLGFSILDYQDPLNPQETVIVIRSLVPGGVAEKDGRLIPGDRLVAVNGTNLENATLDQAVAALKGAPKGTVSIAVAKPISVLESTGQIRSPDSDDPTGVAHPRRSLLDAILGELGTPRDTDSQLLDRSLEDDQDLNRDEASEDDLPDYDNDLDDFSEDQMYSGHRHSGSVLSSESEVPPLPLTSPPHTPAFPTDEEEEITEYDNEDSSQELLRCGGPEGEEEVEEGDTLVSREPPNLTLNLASPPNLLPPDTHEPGEVVSPINVYKASVLMVPVATERLIGSGSSTALTPAASSTPLASAHAAHYHATQGSGEEEGGSPQSSPLLPRWVAHPPVLPRELERAIKIKKGADQLGINIEVVDQGVNGVVISSLVRNGAVHKDGRLHAGDLILSVNNESMRNITNSQARAILRRTQLVSTDVSILYIRGQDAAQYREASLLHYRDGQQQQQQQQQQQALQQGQQTQPQTSPRSPYVPRGESSEDEGGAEVGTDLTRSITAPSFITRDLRSRDPSHDDLIGSSGSLQQGQQTETRAEGRSVINIKHALSETFVESLTEESNISSVHIGGEKDRNLEDGEEGPFTITFKNVSAAPADFSARVGQEPEAEDHEVLGVLQDDGVSSGRPPGGDLYTYTNPESFTNIHLLTGTTDSCISSEEFVSGRRESSERGFPSVDSRELPSGHLQQQSSLRLVRFAESKRRSEYSESSDSSAERSSSLFVEWDSDRHSVSDVLSDDLNPPSAKLVVAHITDVENIVQRRSLASSRSFEESPRAAVPCFERQYSEIIPDSVYLTREHFIPSKVREHNQIQASRREAAVRDPSKVVESESNYVGVNTSRIPPGEELPATRRTVGSEKLVSERGARSPISPGPPHPASTSPSPESNHPSAITTTTTTTKAASSVSTTTTTTTATTTTTVTALSPPVKSSMTITQDVTTSEARSNSSSPMLDGKHWGPERTVEVRRDDKNSLGISIVGGKVDLSWSGSSVTGIFIKNVLPDSPAGKGGHLKTGDRILEVEGIDLRGATHEKAVEVIKKTGNPVTFVVQSLVQWTPGNSAPGSRDVSRLGTRYPTSITPARTPTPELIQARTPLSEVSSVQQLPRPAGRPYPQEPRAPVASTIPETSTPIHESCPEPVRFVPESPIPEPEDPDSLVNPYYYYARAALAHWHVRAQRTKEIQPVVEDDGDSSDQENSTSSSSGSTASRRILRLKHFCPHYGVTRTRPNGSKMDTPPSDTPLMDTPPSDGPAVEESLREEPQTPDFPRDKPPPSESFMMELSCEPILIECEEIETVRTYPQTNGLVYGSSVQSESLQSNPELDIIQCKDNDVALDSNIIQTQILLDDLPVPSLNDPEVEEYTYDWRKDPHLYQGWWCVGGSVSEHLAAQVPTQPVSPYDSPAHSPTNTPTIEQPGLPDIKKQEIQANLKKPLNRRQTTEDSDNDLDDVHYQQGRIETKKGVEIDRASAGALRRSKAEKASDTEEEDEFGYTTKKIQKKYADLKGEVVVVELQKGANGLGISLAGNKDRTLMSAFVCGLNPNGNAFKDGKIKVGDEVLEVNGNVIHGRCHLNASSIFKGIPGPKVKIIVLRKKTGLQEMAIKPITQFPVTLEDETPEEKYARFKGLTNIVMKKGQTGLGIMIIEGKHAEYGNGIFISDLQEGSVAATAGLLVGDMILCVNKEEMVGVDYDQATNILKKTEGVINMWVANAARAAGAKPDVPPKPAIAPKPSLPTKPPSLTGLPPPSRLSPPPMDDPTPSPAPPPRPLPLDRLPGLGVTSMASTTSPSTSPSSQSSLPPTEEKEKPQGSTPAAPRSLTPVDPATAEIRPGKETTIEIVKEKMGLGLSIVGGSDTLLGAIIIHEVYPDGAAAKDGRLKPGDQILNVNNENFREITHQKALSVLRQTPSKEKEKVKMVVYREEGTQKEEDLYDIITVQLTKKSGKGLGLSIVGRKNGPGVFISDVVPGGVAESDGRLMQGDQILEVNDKDLRQATQEQAAAILKCAPGSVSMKLGRLKAGKKAGANNNANSTWPVTISDNSPDVSTSPSPAEPPIPIPRTHLPPHLQTHHPLPPPPQPQHPPKDPQEPLGIRTILLERRDDGLGFSIVGGFGSNLGDLPIYVKSVFERGAAAREGSLRRGDQILEVNGQSLAGLTHADAVAILKEARGSVALTILPSK
ncbi:multiple PDZ domain protein-like isoform X4 [Scylla paramamosain]|uniref:multiple PDZ domain protein-like isoform X4 n=1 Tax=Scylla paramamosain TaxID=85552 RepID=UPI0030832687